MLDNHKNDSVQTMLSWLMSKHPEMSEDQLLGMVSKTERMDSSRLIFADLQYVLSSIDLLDDCYEPAEFESRVQSIIESEKTVPAEISAVQNDDKLECYNADLCSLPVAGSIDNYSEISVSAEEMKIDVEISSDISTESIAIMHSVQSFYSTATRILLDKPIYQLNRDNWAMKELLKEFQDLSNILPFSSEPLPVRPSGSCASIGINSEQTLQLQGEQLTQAVMVTEPTKSAQKVQQQKPTQKKTDAKQPVVMVGQSASRKRRHNAQLASTIIAPKFIPSTARNAVVLILTGLILVMQNAQYDGGGISSVQDSDVWSGRDADTFRGGAHDQSTRNSRLKRSMISGGVSERVQSRSDLALVVSSF